MSCFKKLTYSHLHIWKKLQKIEMIILGIGIMIEEMKKKRKHEEKHAKSIWNRIKRMQDISI